MKVKTENIYKNSKKYFILITFIIFLALFIILMLIYLQIFQGDYFLSLSEKNRIRVKRIAPLRGTIYDSNMNIIATNKPAFSLYLNRKDIKENGNSVDEVINTMSQFIKIDKDNIYKILKKYRKYPNFLPIKILSNLNFQYLSKIETFSFFIPGVFVDFDPIRYYPFKEINAHILGYVLEADKNDIEQYNSLFPGDYVGKIGIEKSFNKFLIGKNGKKIIEVDAKGKELKTLSQQNPVNGNNLVLTIRNDLQKKATQLLKGKSGTIICINPQNGKILCLVSSPSYDPNIFARGINSKEWKSLIENNKHPLTNKAISGQYPPGSTFKVITAIAGLTSNAITPYETIYCSGVYQVGDTKYRCWKKFGHGAINIINAIKESCDVYFYHLGMLTGIDNIYKTGFLFGLGQNTGIKIPGEKTGILPSRKWKKKVFHTVWYPGETPPIAIGQGYTLTTPLQVLMVYATIANNGTLYRPQLVNKITDTQGNILKKFKPVVIRKLPVKKSIFKIIQTGLKKVVNEIHGTAYSSRIEGFEFSGKTGTAQVKKLGEHREKDINKIPYNERDHAWFVAYAPSDHPTFAIVVLLEHAGHGGHAAAPLAKEMIKYYFKK